MKTRKAIILFLFCMAAAMLSGCSQDPDSGPTSQKHGPWGTNPHTGTVTGSASTPQFEPNQPALGEVVITLHLTSGEIDNVDFTGTFGQTENIGKRLIDEIAADQIIANNSVDSISGSSASITLKAIKNAGRKALNTIPGVSEALE